MLFCLSVCDETQRVILDDTLHGEALAVVEAANWVEAQGLAYLHPALDAFTYRAGHGWVRRTRETRVDGQAAHH